MTITKGVILLSTLVTLVAERGNGQAGGPARFRLGVNTASTKRNTSLADVITGQSSAAVQGFEAIISTSREEGGLSARLLSGSYDDSDFSLREARVFVGGTWLQAEGAYGQRSLSGTDSLVLFARGGLRSLVQIGGSGVSLSVAGSKYFDGNFSSEKPTGNEVEGWEGETNIFYTFARVPVYVQLGYRNEYFSRGNRAESMSGLILGTGLWFGGRP